MRPVLPTTSDSSNGNHATDRRPTRIETNRQATRRRVHASGWVVTARRTTRLPRNSRVVPLPHHHNRGHAPQTPRPALPLPTRAPLPGRLAPGWVSTAALSLSLFSSACRATSALEETGVRTCAPSGVALLPGAWNKKVQRLITTDDSCLEDESATQQKATYHRTLPPPARERGGSVRCGVRVTRTGRSRSRITRQALECAAFFLRRNQCRFQKPRSERGDQFKNICSRIVAVTRFCRASLAHT